MLFLRIIKGNLEIWQWIMLVSVLCPMTVKDYRTKKVNSYLCLLFTFASLVIRVYVVKESDVILLLDLLPGIILYLIALLTKESIGKGDAIVLMFIGSVSGFNLELEALFISLILSGVLSLILLVLKKATRKTELPFVPFLSIGVLAGAII